MVITTLSVPYTTCVKYIVFVWRCYSSSWRKKPETEEGRSSFLLPLHHGPVPLLAVATIGSGSSTAGLTTAMTASGGCGGKCGARSIWVTEMLFKLCFGFRAVVVDEEVAQLVGGGGYLLVHSLRVFLSNLNKTAVTHLRRGKCGDTFISHGSCAHSSASVRSWRISHLPYPKEKLYLTIVRVRRPSYDNNPIQYLSDTLGLSFSYYSCSRAHMVGRVESPVIRTVCVHKGWTSNSKTRSF